MKIKLLLFIVLLVSGQNLFGKSFGPCLIDTTQKDTIVDRQAEYPGGMNALGEFLGGKLKYPEKMREQGKGGRVVIEFVIEKNGNLSSFKVVKSAGKEFDDEALRVLKLMPKWSPAISKSGPVAMYFTLPVNFSLQNGDEVENENKFVFEDTTLGNIKPKIGTNMEKFISNNTLFRLPNKPQLVTVEGKIQKDGTINISKVVAFNDNERANEKYQNEAKRILELMEFAPILKDGNAIEVPFSLNFVFRKP